MSGLAFDTGFALDALPGHRLDPARLYDVLVLGAGPAGIAAAIYAVRKGHATGVLAQLLGGQVAWTSEIENYPGYRLVDGATLVARFREQVAEFPPDLGLDLEATAVTRVDAGFAVLAGGAEYRSRTLVVATGKRPRLLGVPGEQRLLGRGVAVCAICDAPLYRGKVVGVVGGGNSGLEAALDLAKVAARVVLFQDLDRLTGDALLERRVRALPQVEVRLRAAVTAILGEERVRAVLVRSPADGSEREVPLDGVFVEIGLDPNSGFLGGLVPLNGRGEIEVDSLCRTAVPGLFAAGDVTSVPFKQIVVAAGEGAKAALSACGYLRHGGDGAGANGGVRTVRMLNEQVTEETRRILAAMRDPVEMTCFSQEDCHPCVHLVDLAREVAALSPALRLVERDFTADAAAAARLGVPRVPGLALARAGEARVPVRYSGIPSGHEFGAFLRTLLALSTGTGMAGVDAAALAPIVCPASLQVFVLPACQRCPEMAWLCNSIAAASPLVTSTVIDADAFPELTKRYAVGVVPKVVINDTVEVPDVVPVAALVAKIAAAC